jgi:hypothetical protein
MRTKTILLSALLGTLGSIAVMAQSTNVYSLNAVGYVNVTVLPGFNIVSCPLIASPNNMIGNVLNNSANQYKKVQVYQWIAATGTFTNDEASTSLADANGFTNGWEYGGFITLNPGQAMWVQNPNLTNLTFTFVGTVPSGSLTNPIVTGFNMISSILPTSGDLVTNSLTDFSGANGATKRDQIYVWDPTIQNYDTYSYAVATGWTSNSIAQDPLIPNVGEGFWYQTGNAGISWVENFSVNQ